jgi:uncharacterized repeat protein (TIGR01451 family)
MTTSSPPRINRFFGTSVLRTLVLLVVMASLAQVSEGAVGDPQNPSLPFGGSGHDPLFMDFNEKYGIAELSNGNFVTCWRTRDNGATPSPDGHDYGAFFQVFNANGTAITSGAFPYNDINPSGTGEQNTPLVTALSGGGFALVWDSNGGPGDVGPAGDAADTYTRVFNNSGNPVSSTIQVNDASLQADEELPEAVIALSGGGYAVVWRDDNELAAADNKDDYYLRVFSAAGAAVGGSVMFGDAAHNPLFQDFNETYGIAELSNGNIATCWRTRDNGATPSPDGHDYGAFFQVFNSSGATVAAAAFPYADINAGGTGEQNTPMVTALSGGGFALMWDSNGGPGDVGPAGDVADTYTRVFNNSGAAVSSTTQVNDATLQGDEELPEALIALSGGGYAVVWRDDNELAAADNKDDYYLRVFSAAGAAVGGSVMFGGTTHNPLFQDFNEEYGIAELGNGNIVTCWRTRDNGATPSPDGHDYGAFFQVFNSSGVTVAAAAFPYADINAGGTGEQNTPMVTALSGGGFALMWDSNGGPGDVGPAGDAADTYTRVFDNTGAAVSSTTQVNDASLEADEELPEALIGLAAGDFVTIWRDDNELAAADNKDDYYARVFEGASAGPSVDIQLSKTDSIDPVVAGSGAGNLVYVITATNNGPDDATGVAITEAMTNPTGVSVDSVTPSAGDYVGTSWNLGSLPSGSSATLTVVLTVGASTAAGANVIANTASVTAVNETDTDSNNDSVTESTSVARLVDLAITKTESVDPVLAGSAAGNLVYVVTVTNNGPSNATGVSISEDLSLPAGVTRASVVPSAGSFVDTTTPDGTWTLDLAATASATLTVTLSANASAAVGTDLISNTATVTGTSGGETLTNTGNDSVTVSTSVVREVDLVVTKTESVDPVAAGPGAGNLVYVVSVTNNGPSDATGVSVSEDLTLPAGVTRDSVVPSAGSFVDTAAPDGTWTLDLAASASATLTVTLSASASTAVGTDVISGTAAVTGTGGGETLTNTGDDSVTVSTSVTREVDLVVTKTESVDPVVAGSGAGNLVYVVTVTNIGPSDATGVSISEDLTLPAGVARASVVPSTGSFVDTTTPDGAWTLDLAATASATLTVTLTADATTVVGTDVISNTATVTGTGGGETLINTGDDSVTVSTSVAAEADLAITATDSPDPVFAGNQLVYTVRVDNAGPSQAVDVVVTDTLPAGVTLGTSTGCLEDPAGVPTCNLGSIAAGGFAEYTIAVDVDPATRGVITNQVTVSTSATDPNAANDSASEDTTVDAEADLALTKTDSADPLPAGELLVYTLMVSNDGPSDATDVVVTDTLPSGVTFVSTSGCAEDPGGAPDCTLGTIGPGASAQYTLTVAVDPVPPSSITNSASVAATENDPDPSNNIDDEETTLDTDPPVLTALNSDQDTGDGAIDECETALVPITKLLVTFSEGVMDPPGDSDPDDVTNPDSFLVLAAGPDGDFSTSACGTVFGDDLALTLSGVVYDAGSYTARVAVDLVLSSQVRFLVCGSAIKDLGGNPFDGDGDGNGGDDFVVTFRADPFNLFDNGHFDCPSTGLGGWDLSDPVEITYNNDDIDGSTISGSVQIMQLAANTSFEISQCVSVIAKTTSQLSAGIRMSSGSFISVSAGCEYFATPTCGATGTGFDGNTFTDLLSDTGSAWVPISGGLETPDGALSARCAFNLTTGSGADFTAWMDDLFLSNGSFIFDDGFESGGTSAWSLTAP